MARRTSAMAARATVPTSACVYGLNTSPARGVLTFSPAMRRLSRRTAVAVAPGVSCMASSGGTIEYPVEGVEVAPAPLVVEVGDATVHDERHRLLGDAAVRAQWRIEARQIMFG